MERQILFLIGEEILFKIYMPFSSMKELVFVVRLKTFNCKHFLYKQYLPKREITLTELQRRDDRYLLNLTKNIPYHLFVIYEYTIEKK